MQDLKNNSFEQLLTAGCDRRLRLGDDGLNGYGCGAVPRPVIGFGSCTCSSPSSLGYHAALEQWQALRAAAQPDQALGELWQRHRDRLRRVLQLGAAHDLAFTPSGTDAELLVLALASAGHTRRIRSIVLGPTEVGSGTPAAAAGCHYDSITPRGESVVAGTAVNSALAARVLVTGIALRDHYGVPLDPLDIDAAVIQAVTDAVSRDEHALLHVVTHSKTGIAAPSWDCVARICEHLAQDVTVVVDAAQGRLPLRRMNELLDRGYLTIFTGSKFYGGPPFSGAVLVPETYHPRRLGMESLPIGLDQYFSRRELPDSWQVTENAWPNYGAALRWEAALAEIEAYEAIPATVRETAHQAFGTIVTEAMRRVGALEWLPSCHAAATDSVDAAHSIFSFRIREEGRYWSRDELKTLHAELNRASSADIAETSDPRFTSGFHLGQPVVFADGSAALRVASGAELIRRVTTDQSLGDDLSDRLQWLQQTADELRQRLQQRIAPATGRWSHMLGMGI